MLQNEDLARLKMNEAIQNGINAQRISRQLRASKSHKSHQSARLRSFLIVAISLTLVGAVAILGVF